MTQCSTMCGFASCTGGQAAIGSADIAVTALGRIFVSGNSGTHTVKLVDVSTGTDVAGGSVSINMSGGAAGTTCVLRV